MDLVAFCRELHFKEPKDLVKHFSENVALYGIITHNTDATVSIKQTKNNVKYIITPTTEADKEFIDNELKYHTTVVHGKQYHLKVNRKNGITSVEVRSY